MRNRSELPISELMPSMSREDCTALCEELELVEMIDHGDSRYIRLTQQGIDVVCVLVELLANMSDPDAVKLRVS
jgi:hypothetical protein